jgi:hypothetical protein
VNGLRQEPDDVSRADRFLALAFEPTPSATPKDVPLWSIDARNNGPRAVVMRQRASTRKPGDGHKPKTAIRFLM